MNAQDQSLEDTEAAGIQVTASTDLVLADGATVNIKAMINYKTTRQSEAEIQDRVITWFSGADRHRLTFVGVHHGLQLEQMRKYLAAAPDAQSASIIGFSLVTPPILAIEEKSKEVTSILASGETIKLKFAPPEYRNDVITVEHVSKVYRLLTTLKFSQLSNLPSLLNNALGHPENSDWHYVILGVEQLSCPCKPI